MSKNKKISSVLILVLLISFSFSIELPYKEGEILVRFSPKEDKTQRTHLDKNKILSIHQCGTVDKTFNIVKGLSLVKLPVDTNVANAAKKLKNKEGILYAEPNYKIKLCSTFPNDTYFNELWGLHNTGQAYGTPDADIDAPQAWDLITDSDIIVAVIDSGIDYNHPDLRNNMWVNEAEFNGDPNVDDDEKLQEDSSIEKRLYIRSRGLRIAGMPIKK